MRTGQVKSQGHKRKCILLMGDLDHDIQFDPVDTQTMVICTSAKASFKTALKGKCLVFFHNYFARQDDGQWSGATHDLETRTHPGNGTQQASNHMSPRIFFPKSMPKSKE